MKITKRHLAILALIANSVIWGAAAPIFKWSLQDIPPFTLAFLRFIFASLLILPFVLPKVAIKRTDFSKIFILSLIGIFIHIGVFFFGLQLASSINVPIIGAATPIFLIIGSIWYLHEKPSKKVLFGTLLSLVGVSFIIIRPLFEQGPDISILGNFLFLLSAISMVVYTLLLKEYNLPYPPLTIVFWTFLLGALMFAPLFFMELQMIVPTQEFDYRALIGVLYGAVFSSTVAYLFYDFGVEYIKGSEIGVFSYLDPITTILVAVPLLGETITPSYLIGAIFVFAGIFIAEGKMRYHPIHLLLQKKKTLED